jgi:hypothetical protein
MDEIDEAVEELTKNRLSEEKLADLLQEITGRILAVSIPEQIILFYGQRGSFRIGNGSVSVSLGGETDR